MSASLLHINSTHLAASSVTCRMIRLQEFKDQCEFLSRLSIPVIFDVPMAFNSLQNFEMTILSEGLKMEEELLRSYREARDEGRSIYVRSLDIHAIPTDEVITRETGVHVYWEFTSILCHSDMDYIIGVEELAYFNVSKLLREILH